MVKSSAIAHVALFGREHEYLEKYFAADREVVTEFREGIDACIEAFRGTPRKSKSLDDWKEGLSDSRVPEEPWESEEYLQFLQDNVVAGAVRVGRPEFVGHMTSALPAYLPEISRLLVELNQNVVKIETSNVLTLIERQVLAMMHRVTYGKDDSFYDQHIQVGGSHLGVVTSGGSLANITAMWLARNKCFAPDGEFLGQQRRGFVEALQHYGYKDAVIIGSQLMHYSMDKIGSIMGFGQEQILKIPCDDTGAVRIDLLEETIERCQDERRMVVALVGIAATTETGAVDDLATLADVAESHGVHFHVDAAWGGPILFSEKHRHLLTGIERADTVTICGHKQLYLPQGISMVLCRDPKLVRHIRTEARYQARAQSIDLGKHSAEGSRPANALYLHSSLHLLGRKGFGFLIDQGIRKAQIFAEMVRDHPAFELVHEPKTNLVVYRYLPIHLRGPGRLSPEDEQEVNGVNEALQDRQFADGDTFISRTTLPRHSDPDLPGQVVLRAVFANPLTADADLDRVLAEQVQLAELVLKQTTMGLEDVLAFIYPHHGSIERSSRADGLP